MPEENEDQYIWRICSQKDSGALFDLSWTEVGRIINSELKSSEKEYCDESAYRKKYQYAKQLYENVFAKMQGEDYYNIIKNAKRDLEKERKKIQTEKLEYNRWLREDARNELIAEKIINAIYDLEPLSPPDVIVSGDNKNKSYVLAFGDAHYGTSFTINGLHGEVINAYNPDIFEERMEQLLNKTVSFIIDNDISELYVFDLGDAIDGLLRVGQLAKLKYGVVDSTMKYAQYMAGWINRLSEFCIVHYRTTFGNHSQLRMLGQPKGTFEYENLEKIIIWYIMAQLQDNENVDFDQNDTNMIFEEIQGFNVVGFHGESKDMAQTLKDFSQMYNIDVDILISGHLHHSYSETVGCAKTVLRTPSIIGIDDYSMKLHRTSDAGATLFCIEEDNGKVSEYNIKLC